jgi:hypothetical protein
MRNRTLLFAALAALLLTHLSCATERVEGQIPGDCTDGADNDEDGFFDCADPSCEPAPACSGDDDDSTPPLGDDDDDTAGDDDTGHGDDDSSGDPGDDDSAGGPGDDDSASAPGDDDTANPGEWQSPGDCLDGVDNDGDMLIDCKDPDCGDNNPECVGGDDDDSALGDDDDSAAGDDDSAGGGPSSGVEDCDNGLDDDSDGAIDCLDWDCNGASNCGSTFSGATIGTTTASCAIAASDTSDCLLSLGNPEQSSNDNICPGEIVEMAITLNATHADVGDLTVSLVDPGSSNVVVLVTAGALSGANFTATVFVDCSGGGNCPGIGQGSSPYTGDHEPEGSMGGLNGFDINGDWTLRVENTGATAGTVDDWSIGAVLALSSGTTCP